jgi:predicted Zn-dependent protease
MQDIAPPDSHHLRAAIGWLELGNVKEAQAEWRRISDHLRDHPGVLEVAWQIHAVDKKWSAALEVATKLLEYVPDSPAGWICQSYTLHEMKRTQEAWERLLRVVDRFPGEGTIPYNLACYACQMGELEVAKGWLAKAIKIKSKFKQMAQMDPDLKPLRARHEHGT